MGIHTVSNKRGEQRGVLYREEENLLRDIRGPMTDTYRFNDKKYTFDANRCDGLVWNSEPHIEIRNVNTPTHYAKTYTWSASTDLTGWSSE
jgi:hypothetical protein